MLKFLAFADSHYRKGMYRTSVEDIQKILRRAHEENVDFVIHAGDMCNDYRRSPEFIHAYLNNPYDLPVYGVFGNHELESENTMEFVAPRLCNREVHFGVPLYNETVAGHWYADIKGYRLIGLDTNFVYRERDLKRVWERKTDLYNPSGTFIDDCLAPAQLEWLYHSIDEARALGLKVITVSHAALADLSFECCPDAEHVQNIFAKFPKTVLLAINGHYHTDHCEVHGGVCYFDLNTAINGCWEPQSAPHYAADDTFPFTEYDPDGNPLSTTSFCYNDLMQGWNTWSFEEPLSAIVTIDENRISIKGSKTRWSCGVVPTTETVRRLYDGIKPEIPDREIIL